MKKHLITTLLISFLLSGVAFGEGTFITDEDVAEFAAELPELKIEPQVVGFWFGLKAESLALTISGHGSCFSVDRCRMTVTFPDGSHKVIVWDIEDKPLKIEMEPLSDEEGK